MQKADEPHLNVSQLLSHDDFKKFCEKNDISPLIYEKSVEIPRFVRTIPSTTETPTQVIGIVKKELEDRYKQDISIDSVSWIPEKFGFFQLSQDFNISQCESYKNGKIYGIDISSAMAVFSLNPKPNEHVLDLCCAPGAKLCFIQDYVTLDNNKAQSVSLTGTDINLSRLHTCKTLLKKYKTLNTRLLLADGTKYNCSVPPLRKEGRKIKKFLSRLYADGSDKNVLPDEIPDSGFVFYESPGVFTEMFREEQRIENTNKRRKIETPVVVGNSYPQLYDKVLVDAECSTDGSIKHLLKVLQGGWEVFNDRILDQTRMNTITDLQKRLISNGFSLLKPDGVMVYSTCSLTRDQNEGVVEWLLSNYKEAVVVEPFEDLKQVPYREGKIKNTARLDPIVSNTSGLFIARIKRQIL
ncbi:ribosomal RNA small subunit methyltransferase F [Acrasis kona]|uniref:Ribosomal RNA small subunit methyltransferase F n=1 Tax=Acrasis kona TaxID=1008807 RepID=A0AAW2YPC2_9EUKA